MNMLFMAFSFHGVLIKQAMDRQFSQGVVDYLIKSVDRPLILRRRGCCHRQPTSFNVPPRRVCPRCALRAHRRVLVVGGLP